MARVLVIISYERWSWANSFVLFILALLLFGYVYMYMYLGKKKTCTCIYQVTLYMYMFHLPSLNVAALSNLPGRRAIKVLLLALEPKMHTKIMG